jgi:hypothetical protein
LEESIQSSEPLARFITQKAYYRSASETVKHNAFMPNREGKTSVYRIIGLGDPEIFEIGQRFVAEKMNKLLLGRADIKVLKILEKDLSVISHPVPHPRHANIVDWPEEREKYRLIAIELADEAELHLL